MNLQSRIEMNLYRVVTFLYIEKEKDKGIYIEKKEGK
jgi:hypothetical protein